MRKTFIALVLLVSSSVLVAQQTLNNDGIIKLFQSRAIGRTAFSRRSTPLPLPTTVQRPA